MEKETSFKEQRIRKITQLYYSRPDVQDALFKFSKDREICPRYFEGFGKRPDTFQYKGDIFELVKKGATSFHCSEELWKDPLKIVTGMSESDSNELRSGWDFLIDIDSKYIDYSKILAKQIIQILEFHGIKNIGIKFSGSKGFHLIVPWKAFPKEINGVKTTDMFPQWARILSQYITEKTKPQLITELTKITTGSKYVKDTEASKEVMPDIILVSPRHLFRMPYSLHEKTALASIVLTKEELENFQPKDADPMNAKVRNFFPDSREGEASELLREALDWYRENKISSGQQDEEKITGKYAEFKPVNIPNLNESIFPPSIKKILEGVSDGKKRALFVLINFFRSVGMDKEEMEKRIEEWNKKNRPPLMDGYIKTQLLWSYRRKPILPPNYDKDYYKGIGVIPTDEELRLKNPVTFVVRKNPSVEEKPKKKNK